MSQFLTKDYSHLESLARRDEKGSLAKLSLNIDFNTPLLKQMNTVLKYFEKRMSILGIKANIDNAVHAYMLTVFMNKDVDLLEKLEGSEIDVMELFGRGIDLENEVGSLDQVTMYIYKVIDETSSGKTLERTYFVMVSNDNKVKKYNNVGYFYKSAMKGKYQVTQSDRFVPFNLSTLYSLTYFFQWFMSKCPLDKLRAYASDEDDVRAMQSYIVARFGQKKTFAYYKYSVIFEAFILYVLADHVQYVSFSSTKKFQNEAKKQYAKAFQTKSYIKQETQRAMGNTSFLHNFKYVELDNDVDLEKFEEVDMYYQAFAGHFGYLLPRKEEGVDLRFRKLGNYRAAGIYFPDLLTIAIDMRSLTSFIHEVGHFNDHKHGMISLSPEFIQDVVVPFTKEFSEYYKKEKHIPAAMYSYYITASEVFARAFEVYFKYRVLEGGNSMFIKSKSDYETKPHYKYLVNNLESISKHMEVVFNS